MSWTLYRHAKGMQYLGITTALHSEDKDPYTVYRCLYPNELAKTWIRPQAMFEGLNDQGKQRFEPIAKMRIVEPEDEATVLAFGFDAWGGNQTLEAFIASYGKSLNHLRGTRYLLETLNGTPVSNLNVLRFARGVMGIASVATCPNHRGRGYAQLLLKAVMELKRLESGDDLRFLLYSEVNPRLYEECGFVALGDEHQSFKPALAMMCGSSDISPTLTLFLKPYF
jgi:GNAT superfamily N-acetyltransferase